MQDQTVQIASQAIHYIENHLHDPLDLDSVAAALHYSKYHLHRIFTKTVDLTIHEYTNRRRLTEAAKLLTFTQKPIIEIALISGYQSQQAFTDSFFAMYKTAPMKFRKTQAFYPLQHKIHLKEGLSQTYFTKDQITFATPADVDVWMELVSLGIDGYPKLDPLQYMEKLRRYIADQKALILKDPHMAIGVLGFSANTGNIDFLAIHPQYRRLDIAKLFLARLTDELPDGQSIAVTTYRAGDKADTGYRDFYCQLGFAARELLVEYGYPTQRFVFPPHKPKGEPL